MNNALGSMCTLRRAFDLAYRFTTALSITTFLSIAPMIFALLPRVECTHDGIGGASAMSFGAVTESYVYRYPKKTLIRPPLSPTCT